MYWYWVETLSYLGLEVIRCGAVAQLGEHLLCTQEVRSSSLLGSTINGVRIKLLLQGCSGNFIHIFECEGFFHNRI